MNQEERKTAIRRMRVLVAAACSLMLLYGLRLIFLQLVNGDDFKSQATNTTDYKFTVTAARGDIVDSRGERIATSVTGYNVVLNKLLMGDEDLDGMLQKIVELLRANGESWNDTLLISQPDAAGNYTFTAEAGSTRDQKALAAMKDNLGLQQYATANDVMEKLVEDYDLASFPLSWQRTLGGIHYEMQLQAFSNVNNFIMAENVSEATVATIKEHSLSLPGVEIVETSTRSYEQSTVLPHVLGRVGKITAEKWKVTDENGQVTYPLREKGYNMNDIIGISGLESAYEDELRGKDGVETITRNSDGVIVDTALTTVPEPGHTVQLTIDSRFQKAVDKALAENIDMINRVYNTGSMKAAAGAAVVLDVKDGSVLAASNYPSFDQNLYATQYSEYSADESLPLFNRALQGLYTPGSTFKPAVAIAALDTGLINRYSTVNCTRVYTYYKDYRPKCTQHGHGNGPIDVVNAIKWSCNIFFYDVGRRLTSDVYDAYAYKLGLGQRTGVEVSEATGHLTTKNDSNYMESLDIQAAIGQGNTVVTPVQLATYAATIANRGTRYRTHFVKAILDSNTGEVLQETQPEVMDVIEDKGETFDLIQQGMIGVSQTISALANYPYTIACKTGTPQRSEGYYSGSSYRHYTNTMMIAYGPTEDAQIAIGIVVEYGGGGARAGNLMADIFNAYFAMQDGTLNDDGTIGKQETAADSTSAAQTAPAQTETGTDTAADAATDPAAGTTDAVQETAPAGQDALDN
ncbi:peptidoglycan D,D-transpeptidase FtsI family protein [Faecalibacterium prausnitzii]|uniref:peptidoglycan D,D-transpeptidase FtsI family protein n=1 Tax=Faecalibacterium prausnitzii TaxID=853 RepID=UPI0012DE9FF6|nr:penicillin-binding transpeptidase domain-containing protein [Faecalibacterium prausnitzii]